MAVPLIEQVKIQAEVLVPLVRVLQSELGEERANALVRKAIGPLYRQYGEAWWAQGARDFDQVLSTSFQRFAAGDALDYQVVKRTPDTFDVNVTGCRYAKFYQELGEPELGFHTLRLRRPVGHCSGLRKRYVSCQSLSTLAQPSTPGWSSTRTSTQSGRASGVAM